MNTGLTDQEKESLLKFFLTHCEIRQCDVTGYRVNFFNSDTVDDKFGSIIIKAMDNLRNDALPFIDKILGGEI